MADSAKKYNALIRFFYKVEPERISIDEYCKLRCEIEWLSQVGVINLKIG